MTARYELTKLYHRNKIVRVCMVSFEKFRKGKTETLEHLIGNYVLEIKPLKPEYKNYSHGICEQCIKNYYPTSYNKMIQREIRL